MATLSKTARRPFPTHAFVQQITIGRSTMSRVCPTSPLAHRDGMEHGFPTIFCDKEQVVSEAKPPEVHKFTVQFGNHQGMGGFVGLPSPVTQGLLKAGACLRL